MKRAPPAERPGDPHYRVVGKERQRHSHLPRPRIAVFSRLGYPHLVTESKRTPAPRTPDWSASPHTHRIKEDFLSHFNIKVLSREAAGVRGGEVPDLSASVTPWCSPRGSSRINSYGFHGQKHFCYTGRNFWSFIFLTKLERITADKCCQD